MENSNWMTELSNEVRNVPIINLAIPGSHNSMTYGITSKIAPDANKTTKIFNTFLPFFVKRWAKTQKSSIEDQLRLGIRYFDLRICQKNGKFYYTHGLIAMETSEPLEKIKQFLLHHPEEFIVLDFQHFYTMSPENHQQFHEELINCFNKLIYKTTNGQLHNCSLNRCRQLSKQVLIIYRRCPVALPIEFWPSHTWPTPWPNCSSIKKLKFFLENSLQSRNPAQGYVSQCIITPTGRYIALRATASNVDKRLHPWIAAQTPGSFEPVEIPKVNVFLGDFVNLKDGQFCNWVINLNTKLYDKDMDLKNESNSGKDEINHNKIE